MLQHNMISITICHTAGKYDYLIYFMLCYFIL